MVFTTESTATAFLLRARVVRLWRLHGADDSDPQARDAAAADGAIASTARWSISRKHEAVERVHHPHLASHPDHALAARLYPAGCSAILAFELKSGRDAGRKFIDSLALFSHLANVGDAKSLVIHPATTTHFRMDDAALAAAGIGPGTVRLSIGLEHPDDLIDDLSRALYASQK